MKPLVFIPLIILCCVGSIALILRTAGVRIDSIDPTLAGGIAAIAASVGLVPILSLRQKDAATIVQVALLGTVLHFLCTAILSGIVVAMHLVSFHGPFIFWLLGAFWISLALLVWQLRRVMLVMTTHIKV